LFGVASAGEMARSRKEKGRASCPRREDILRGERRCSIERVEWLEDLHE
jgi:hypothetical protein